jgi:phosphoglycolate phosphatase
MEHDEGNELGGLGAELNLHNGATMTATPTLLVFDCDGTLADSQHVITDAMQFAFLGAGLAAPDRCCILRTVGLSLREAIADLAPNHGPVLRDELARLFRERCTELRQVANAPEPMFAGAVPLLKDLSARDGLFLGIATGKSRRGLMRIIEQNGLEGVFSTIQTADNAPSKPHPAMLHQAMTETGAEPEKTVMIGDTSHDMLMAAAANVHGIGVTWGYHTKAELKRAGAKTIVRSFPELARALDVQGAARFEAVA